MMLRKRAATLEPTRWVDRRPGSLLPTLSIVTSHLALLLLYLYRYYYFYFYLYFSLEGVRDAQSVCVTARAVCSQRFVWLLPRRF